MKIAICGVTGVVGREIIKILDKLSIPVTELACYASERSAGKYIETPFGPKLVDTFDVDKCRDFDFVFLCISGSFSAKYGKKIARQNRIVIDNSSHFRNDPSIPLVIPEINGEKALDEKLISNPNCTTAILVMALYPLYREFGLKKTIVSTYQAASGAGFKAMEELLYETRNYLDNKPVGKNKFRHPIPFNIIPAIDKFQVNGYTREEMKVIHETRKIFGDPSLKISITSVRIPIFRAHSESVTIETVKKLTPEDARRVLENAPGLKVLDDPIQDIYPMPLSSTKSYEVEVGRIRQNLIFGDFGLDFFVSGDQLLKGAALNSVQIAKYIIDNTV